MNNKTHFWRGYYSPELGNGGGGNAGDPVNVDSNDQETDPDEEGEPVEQDDENGEPEEPKRFTKSELQGRIARAERKLNNQIATLKQENSDLKAQLDAASNGEEADPIKAENERLKAEINATKLQAKATALLAEKEITPTDAILSFVVRDGAEEDDVADAVDDLDDLIKEAAEKLHNASRARRNPRTGAVGSKAGQSGKSNGALLAETRNEQSTVSTDPWAN